MGETAPGVKVTSDEGASARTTPREMSETLGREVAIVREELDVLLAELDRRRRDLVNVRLQVRRHPVGAALATLTLIGAAAGVVWLSVRRQRRRPGLGGHADRLREALAGRTEHPGWAAVASTMAGKILTTAASAAVASLVRNTLEPVRRPEPSGHEKGRKAA